jgi:drug/metabolite transporter (DMT)-like permease
VSRLRADLLLVLVAMIWGAAFVAQKNALAHIGPFTFVAARFSISALLVFPLAWRERRRAPVKPAPCRWVEIVMLCLAFFSAAALQQVGLEKTSVTNAGFLTGLYVVFVPIICRLAYRQKLSVLVFPAAMLSIIGVWLLSGGKGLEINRGDILVLLCAMAFAWHITLIGRVMKLHRAPFQLSCLQYGAVALLSLFVATATEHPDVNNLLAAGYAILYAGAISGGIAYTLQVVAQQYTPSVDSAIIMSSEALFAALFAAILSHERLTAPGWAGCGLILAAILLVEFGPFLAARFVKMKTV